jgi:predicted TIM-barrel fold metal-dependent hydrolase
MPFYRGPVIDAHHHLWSYGLGRYGWLERQPGPGEEGLPMGDLTPLRRDFVVEDYLAMAEGENIVATVHIEGGWSGGAPGAETAWLDTLDRSRVAARHVFHVALDDPDAVSLVAAEARHPRAVGLRDIVAWHPDPTRAFAPRPHRMADPAWRKGLAALGAAGLPFDLMLYPHQMDEAADLAASFPDMTFVLNHCGSPVDRSEGGMAAWRSGILSLAACPNVAIKISNPVAYDHQWTQESLAAVILHCLDAFGAERSMFGSDAPVSGLQAPFGRLLDVYRAILPDRAEGAQRAFFHDTAARIYRLED